MKTMLKYAKVNKAQIQALGSYRSYSTDNRQVGTIRGSVSFSAAIETSPTGKRYRTQ